MKVNNLLSNLIIKLNNTKIIFTYPQTNNLLSKNIQTDHHTLNTNSHLISIMNLKSKIHPQTETEIWEQIGIIDYQPPTSTYSQQVTYLNIQFLDYRRVILINQYFPNLQKIKIVQPLFGLQSFFRLSFFQKLVCLRIRMSQEEAQRAQCVDIIAKHFKNLVELQIWNKTFQKNLIVVLMRNLKKLKIFAIPQSTTPLSKNQINQMALSWPSLRELNISNSPVQKGSFSFNRPLSEMINLFVSSCSINDFQLGLIIEAMPNLRLLDIKDNKISSQGVSKLAYSLRRLQFLNLKNNILIGDDGIKIITQKLTQLRSFHADMNLQNTTPSILLMYFSKLKHLETLCIKDAQLENHEIQNSNYYWPRRRYQEQQNNYKILKMSSIIQSRLQRNLRKLRLFQIKREKQTIQMKLKTQRNSRMFLNKINFSKSCQWKTIYCDEPQKQKQGIVRSDYWDDCYDCPCCNGLRVNLCSRCHQLSSKYISFVGYLFGCQYCQQFSENTIEQISSYQFKYKQTMILH